MNASEDGEWGEFIAAGILPYSLSEGSVHFFLGKELGKGPTLSGKNKYVWSDFGGKREGFHETAQDTACREFSEETLGLWGGLGDLTTRVKSSIAIMKIKVQRAVRGEQCDEGRCFILKNGLYVSFVVPVQFVEPLLFQLARDENDRLMSPEKDHQGNSDGCAESQMTSCGSTEEDPEEDVRRRAAEKRDWAWVNGQKLLSVVEAGFCQVRGMCGSRLHLLPRLAITLRTHLRLMLDGIAAPPSSPPPRPLVLLVRLDQECRCLHLFALRPGLTSPQVVAALSGPHGPVHKARVYQDRLGHTNAFVLFRSAAAAAHVRRAITTGLAAAPHAPPHSEGEAAAAGGGGTGWPADALAAGAGLWDGETGPTVEYAWFEHGGENAPSGVPRGDNHAQSRAAAWSVERRHTDRCRKLGIGPSTAPWAPKRPTLRHLAGAPRCKATDDAGEVDSGQAQSEAEGEARELGDASGQAKSDLSEAGVGPPSILQTD